MKLVKTTLIYGVGQILNKCLSLLLLPLFTQFLTPEDYGIASLLALIVSFAVAILSLGIGTSFSISYANPHIEKPATVWSSFLLIGIAVGIFLGGVFFAEQVSYYFFHTPDYASFIILTFLTAACNVLTVPFSLWMQFQGYATAFSVISLLFTFLTLSSNLIGVVYLDLGVKGLVWGNFLAGFSTLLIYLGFTLYHIPFKISKMALQELLWRGLPMIPAAFALFYLQNSQRYFLDKHVSLTELGLYTIGFNLAATLNLLVSAFSTAWTPYFIQFQHSLSEAKLRFSKIFTAYTLCFGTVGMAYFLMAKPVVLLLTHPSFYASSTIIGIVACGWILIGYYNLLNPGIIYSKRTYLNTIIQLMAVGMAWGLNVALIPSYGMLGAALAFTLSHAGMCLIQLGINFYFNLFQYPIEWKPIGGFLSFCLFLLVLSNHLSLSLVWTQMMWAIFVVLSLSVWSWNQAKQLHIQEN